MVLRTVILIKPENYQPQIVTSTYTRYMLFATLCANFIQLLYGHQQSFCKEFWSLFIVLLHTSDASRDVHAAQTSQTRVCDVANALPAATCHAQFSSAGVRAFLRSILIRSTNYGHLSHIKRESRMASERGNFARCMQNVLFLQEEKYFLKQ